MDSSLSSAAASGLVPGPNCRTHPTIPVPADFVPLRLILQPGGAAIELSQPDMLLGRHSQADVRLPLPDVSRRHCRFIFSQGIWQVLDLNSLNGVFLNDRPIRQAPIQHGDLLRIGGFIFVIDVSGASRDVTEVDESEGLIRGLFKTLPLPSQDPEPRRRAS
jgi:pSer/pThr/pTyr-binding forkhead associated (FHA) protein